MDDLTITRRCGEAIGLKHYEWDDGDYYIPDPYGPYQIYDPLHNDIQCFALVKKFELSIGRNQGVEWDVENRHSSYGDDYVCVMNKDLNHAVCECVARMQQAKR